MSKRATSTSFKPDRSGNPKGPPRIKETVSRGPCGGCERRPRGTESAG
jgi:hypothetical protein